MERYHFSGFVFGFDKQYFQLVVRTLKENGIGYTAEFAMELTAEERLELINLLITMNKKEDN